METSSCENENATHIDTWYDAEGNPALLYVCPDFGTFSAEHLLYYKGKRYVLSEDECYCDTIYVDCFDRERKLTACAYCFWVVAPLLPKKRLEQRAQVSINSNKRARVCFALE